MNNRPFFILKTHVGDNDMIEVWDDSDTALVCLIHVDFLYTVNKEIHDTLREGDYVKIKIESVHSKEVNS